MALDLEARVSELETWRTAEDIRQAASSYQWEFLNKRFDSLDRRLDRYDAHISKFIWAVIMASIAVVMAFIFRGGLLLAPPIVGG